MAGWWGRHRWPVLGWSALAAGAGGVLGYTQGGDLTPDAWPGFVSAGGGVVGAGLALAASTGLSARDRRRSDGEAVVAGRAEVLELLPLELPELHGSRPSAVLVAEREVADFRGRGSEVTALREWCADAAGPVACVLSGGSEVGKTRFTLELATYLMPEWTVGRLRSGHERDAVAKVLAAPGRSLVLVEGVVGRAGIGEFLHQAYRAGAGRLRVILVTRSEAGLESVARTMPSESREVLREARRCHLDAFGGAGDLKRWYDEARLKYAEQAGLPRPSLSVRGPEAQAVAALRRVPDLEGAAAERVLSIARWAHGLYPGEVAGSVARPSPSLLADGLMLPGLTESAPLREALFADFDLPRLGQVLAFLAAATETYPPAAALVQQVLIANGRQPTADFLLLTAASGPPSRRLDDLWAGLIAGAGLTVDQLDAVEALIPTSARQAHLATATERVDRLRDGGDAVALAVAFSRFAVALGRVGRYREALAVHEEAVGRYRVLAAEQPGVYGGDLAMAVRSLGFSLEQVNRYPEALAAFEEAVNRYRALARELPDVYGLDLADARKRLRDLLRRLDREDEFPVIDLRADGRTIDLRDDVPAEKADPEEP